MKDLLVGPWQRSANDRRPELPSYLVVIDALDEIEGEGGPAFLRDLLMTVNSDQLQGLKFLITSRPHPELASLCARFSSDVCRLHEVPMDTVKADIMTYLKHKLPNLRDEPRLTDLAQKADGLFIYAATVVRYITPRPKMAKGEQIDLMRKLFGSTWAMSSTTASLVDELYRQILREASSNKNVYLHPIAAALSCDTGTEEQASIIVDELHAVLYVKEGGVFWYHASFQDFIVAETRSKFTISARAASNDRDDLLPCIENFFPIYVSFWIEAMNLLRSSHQCPSMLRQAHEWVLKGDEFPSSLATDIAETFDFATYFTSSPTAQ
ncbi:hypothetical protein AX14_007211 [Amanita brunnescens Koide BX004]|nr:hypothetical protein AX14_007211 [Amanita brunnescens Koide BX004]